MDFLDKIYFDNSVKSYLFVAGIILLALLLKKFLSRYIAAFLSKLFRKLWGNVEKKHFIALFVQPIGLFLLILVILFSFDKLHFPEEWKYSIYGIHTENILDKSGIGILIISFTWVLLRLIDFIAMVLEYKANLTPDQNDNQLIVFFKDFLKVFVILGSLLCILKFCFSQPIGPLVAGLGIAGAAIALASKESLENIIASFVIFFDKPFTTGDVLKVQNITGTVERIGLRSTRIRTVDKTLVTVPNKQMVDSIVDNYSVRTERRAEIKLELAPGTPATKIEELLAATRKLLGDQPNHISSYSVYFKDIGRNGLTVTAEYFTQPVTQDAFDALKEVMILSVKKMLESAGIEMAGVVMVENVQG